MEELPASPTPPRDDESANLLVERVQSGDPRAYRAFVEKYQRLVAAIVFRLVYNPADREELCQEIFLKIFTHIGQFQGGNKVASWIGRIAANTCINHLRKKRPVLYHDAVGPGADLENVAGCAPGPEAAGEEADLSALLRVEIERLPAPQRLALTLFHFAGMNYDEIGRAMNLPVGTVKSHLFRARGKLRQRLAPALQEDA